MQMLYNDSWKAGYPGYFLALAQIFIGGLFRQRRRQFAPKLGLMEVTLNSGLLQKNLPFEPLFIVPAQLSQKY